MTARKNPHSTAGEPHFGPGASRSDPSENKAANTLGGEDRRHKKTRLDGHGVYDEPDILPGRPGETIEQDWSCSECGYNLRGLPVGHRCPECNHIELYRPPPPGVDSYASRFRLLAATTSPAVGWSLAVVAALMGGLFAIFGALFESIPTALGAGTILLVVVFGPAIEEAMKIAAAALVVELRPYFFTRPEQIQLATVGTALVFAVIENIIYLTVYVQQPSYALIAWRWSVCVVLHVGCTTIASRGLIRVWQRTMDQERQPRMTDSAGALAMAIVLHGAYNAAVVAFEMLNP